MGSADGYMYAITTSGAQKWKFNAGYSIYNGVTVGSAGSLYFSTYSGIVYALSPATGIMAWQYDTGATSFSSPAVGPGNVLYYGSGSGYLYVFSASGSVSRYMVSLFHNLYPPTVSSNGKMVYVGDYYRYGSYFYAFNTSSKSVSWKFATSGATGGAPVVGSDGSIYFGCDDFHVYALTPAGKLKWSYVTGDVVESTPAVYGGVVYVGSKDGVLYALNAGKTRVSTCDVFAYRFA